MSAPALDRTFLFRIVHWECLPDVLVRGFYPKRHPGFQIPKLRIGDMELADKRESWALRTPGAGTIGEHVAFYFAGHSPMLYKIKTGYGVPQVDQRDIVYICLKLRDVVGLGHPYLYTDGQANTMRTAEYTDLSNLVKLDWIAVRSLYWRDDESDRDRERKKQAEFLLKGPVPVSSFKAIYVFDEERRKEISALLAERGMSMEVRVDNEHNLYYG